MGATARSAFCKSSREQGKQTKKQHNTTTKRRIKEMKYLVYKYRLVPMRCRVKAIFNH